MNKSVWIMKTRQWLWEYKFSLLCCLYLTVLAFYLKIVFIGWNPLSNPFTPSVCITSLMYIILNVAVIWAILNLISHIPKAGIVLVMLLAIILSLEATLAIAFSTQITLGIYASIIETNSHEAWVAIRMYSLIAIPLLVVTGTIFYMEHKELKNKKPHILLSAILILAGLAIGYVAGYWLMNKSEKSKVVNELNISCLMHFQTVLGTRFPLLTNIGFGSVAYYQEMAKFGANLSKPKKQPEGVNQSFSANAPHTLFVVLGESSLQTHYSLYGYEVATTPFLDSLKMADRLLYYDALSPAAITRDALCIALSFATPLNREPFVDTKNIITLANECGYQSYWISNQDKLGMHDSYVGMVASYADTAHFSNYLEDDLQLIHRVNTLYNPHLRQVFFIHLKGSHLEYGEKYDELDSQALPSTGSKTLDYDRSIHHTDRVLGSLYNNVVKNSEADSTSAILFYFSDHGEIINKGHGFLYKNMDQFLIPFVAISNNYTPDIAPVIDKYIAGERLNTTNFSYIFSEIIGYKIAEKTSEKAKNDALYYYHVDGKTYLFDDIKK